MCASHRKAARQDRVLSSNHGSSATALQADAGRASSPAPAAVSAGKGPADFRVPGLRDSAALAPADFASSMPAMSRRDVEDACPAAPGPPAAQSQQQLEAGRRPRKLIRNPNNTSHRPRSHPSRFSQSMDFVRPRARNSTASPAPRSRTLAQPFSQLLACCSPVGLFRRGPSYGSMRTDGDAAEGDDAEADTEPAQDSPVARPQLPPLVRDSPLAPHVGTSATDTAVVVGSLDDQTNGSSKGSASTSNGPKHVGPPDDTDDAAESDWLVSRSDRGRSSYDTDDYSSPGSGLPGIAAGSAMPVPAGHGMRSAGAADLETDPGDSLYRTPPTSLGDMPGASSRVPQGSAGLARDSAAARPTTADDIPTNTMSKLYLGDEAYEHVPRRLTVDSSMADRESVTDRAAGAETGTSDGRSDLDADDESLRAEITSPPNNVVSASSERLVTHVEGRALLPALPPQLKGRKCLVLDLDETLVHSSFREVDQPDYVVPVILEGQEHSVYVVKRPGVDEFINVVGQYYEVVVFTASLSMVSPGPRRPSSLDARLCRRAWPIHRCCTDMPLRRPRPPARAQAAR
ncbi:hypothetical protein H4R21_003181 [Coemansia helicoidea]|uniref:Uncharacterized protein n=1 Tax=Coemansia helicoidea TaxID=1286919 RepID=A0ACC1L3X9_9FUNG|nr:hypothetical protein H4R21_003181 [Coemansia helicoidea]